MKRKLTVLALSFIMVVACALAFTACSGNEGSKVNSGEKYTIQTAYEQAKNFGYTGTLEEFTESIQGEDGKDVGISYLKLNSNGELVVILTDNSKINFGVMKDKDGTDGKDGKDGKDGVGVQSVVINAENHLIITLTNGSKIDVGNVKGADGKNGLSITDADIINGVLKLTFSDGTITEVGSVLGISSVTVNEQGEMVVKGTDGSILYQGKIPTCVHTWSDWTLGLAPTCTSMGYNTRTCEACGYVQYDFKEELGHTFGEWHDITYSCTESYLQMKICSVCGDTQLNEAMPSGHTWSQGVCVVCGQTELDNFDIARLNLYNGTYGYEYLGTMEKGEILQKLYMDIDKAVRDFHVKGQNAETNVFATPLCDYQLTEDEIVSVWKTYKDDNPLYYWLSNSLRIDGDKLVLMTEEEYKNGEARTAQNKIVYDAISKYTSLVSESDSDYRIALAYHDAIINAVDYAYASEGTPETAYWAHSILGVFKEQGAVCEGYARTYQLLLNASGVENLFVTGMGNSELHAWNTVLLDDGNWYWCDLTWDDDPKYKWGIKYNYFCAIDSEFLKNHKTDTSSATGVKFLYELPQRSTKPFADSNQTILNNIFTVGNLECTVVGFNTVELNSITGEGSVAIPETVSYNGVTYSVISLGKSLTYSGILSSGITDVFVPKTVKFIWNMAFRSPNLKSITVDNGNKYFLSLNGVLYSKSLYTLIQFPSAKEITSYTIPDETREITHMSFDKCKYLQTLYVGKNVEIVGISNNVEIVGIPNIDIIFSGEWTRIIESMVGNRKIIIDAENPNYILDDFALYNGDKSKIYYIFDKTITTYQVPANLCDIDSTTTSATIFQTCTQLQSFTVEEGNQWFSAEGGILYNKDKTQIVCVPMAIEGTVTIHDGVTLIDRFIFSGRTRLKNVILSNSITTIETAAFSDCVSLASVTIPNGVVSIGNSAFSGCRSLTNITLPNSVTFIDTAAFEGCKKLTSITLPNGITSIGDLMFNECTSLTSITLPNSVTSIDKSAFYNCSGLTSITIPNSVTSIGNFAFYGCIRLRNVYYIGTEAEWNAIRIGTNNFVLKNAIRYYYSETEPKLNADGTAYDGNYWHYDANDNIVVWKKQ